MLRIAVPNKGSLSEAAARLLEEAGYRSKRRGRELVLIDKEGGVELFFLRPRDIVVYVAQGTVQAGITGRDLLADSKPGAVELMGLGFGRSSFRFAAPEGTITDVSELAGKRIATSYSRLVAGYLEQKGIEAEVIHLDGAVESSVQLGVADAIADVVETGSTLKAAGLEVFGEPIMSSEAILIAGEEGGDLAELAVLQRRLSGVLIARDHVLLDYNIALTNLPAATAIAPGLESPTVSPLAEPEWRAVRVVVRKASLNQTMDDLLQAGAKGIIVTEIAASRLG